MNLRELVGKRVCRTAPIYTEGYGFGFGNIKRMPSYKYCNLKESITVVEVIDDVPIIKETVEKYDDKEKGFVKLEKINGISAEFDDDNWKSVDAALEYVEKANNILMNKSDSVNDTDNINKVESDK